MARIDPKHFTKELSVGEVAARSGVAVSTLHFYEAQGLITGWRNAGNHRRYARDVLRRVAVIKVAQRAGIPLAAIREALRSLPEGRTPSAAWPSENQTRRQPPLSLDPGGRIRSGPVRHARVHGRLGHRRGDLQPWERAVPP